MPRGWKTQKTQKINKPIVKHRQWLQSKPLERSILFSIGPKHPCLGWDHGLCVFLQRIPKGRQSFPLQNFKFESKWRNIYSLARLQIHHVKTSLYVQLWWDNFFVFLLSSVGLISHSHNPRTGYWQSLCQRAQTGSSPQRNTWTKNSFLKFHFSKNRLKTILC